MPDHPKPGKLTELERQAEEARKKLADTSRRAEESLEHADKELREGTEAQEATEEKLRREVREPPFGESDAAGPEERDPAE